MIENIDKSALVSQRTEAERLTNLLLIGFSDQERKSDMWISILGGYFVGRKEMADLLLNKDRTHVVAYIHNAVIQAKAADELVNGIKELWKIINEQFKASYLSPVFEFLLTKWRTGKEVSEATFIGAWDLASEFKVLDTTYSFLSPENNKIKPVHITEIRNRAASALMKYK